MQRITLHDKTFSAYINAIDIEMRIAQMAADISKDFTDKRPLFLAVLNGAFMFCSDLLKMVTVPCELSFIKLASYKGIESTGIVKELVGLNEDLSGRHIILIEDIVDTGNTLQHARADLEIFEPASVHVATLLFKPQSFKGKRKPDYTGFEIDNRFVVGFGLDYNGLGRNLPEIYQLAEV
jgi:hypoxanthine phosphoribosyltransferase